MRALAGVLFFACGAVLGQDPPRPVADLEAARDLVGEWIEVRKTIARERAGWKLEKEMLAQSTGSFQRELDSLQERLDQTGSEESLASIRLAEARAEKERLVAAEGELERLAVRLEERLRGLLPGLPPPLLEELEPLTARLPKDPEDTSMRLELRLGLLVGLIGEINKFNKGISVASELRQRPDTGQRVQVKVLYLGLSQAFYADSEGSFCGTGSYVPGKGWEWTSRPGMAGPIARAIGMYEGGILAGFVGLPLKVR